MLDDAVLIDVTNPGDGLVTRFTYNGDSGNPLLVDLTAGGGDQFTVTMTEAPATGVLVVSVEDAVTDGALSGSSLPIDGPGDYVLPFSSFTGTTPADLTQAREISLTILADETGGAQMYAISNFAVTSSIPEPGTAALLVVFAGLSVCRRVGRSA